MKPRDADALDVHLGEEHVGRLSRIAHGARFAYDADWVRRHEGDANHSIAIRMPVRAAPYDCTGVNLHPFFAGLLPEGLRLKSLVRAVKTSEDDLFTLLAATGTDTIGDVSATTVGELPEERAQDVPAGSWSRVRFRELLEESLALETVAAQSSVAGIQPKLSTAGISFPLRKRDTRGRHLLKLSPSELPRLVENEAFFMAAARAAGIPTANVEVIHDSEGESGLLVERFDRVVSETGAIGRLHQEDACQLLDRYPADKYRMRLQDVSDALDATSAPIVARLELVRLQAFSYAIANGDLHAKNVSLQRRAGSVSLTPAYDLLSTLPYGDAKLAMSLEGHDERLTWRHFLAFGERNGVSAASVRRVLATLVKRLSPFVDRIAEIGLAEKAARHLEKTMAARLAELDPE